MNNVLISEARVRDRRTVRARLAKAGAERYFFIFSLHVVTKRACAPRVKADE